MKHKKHKKTIEFIEKIRLFEKDHKPEGYPSITMAELSDIAKRLEDLEKINWMHCEDWAYTHTRVEDIAKKYIPEDELYQSGDGFKDIADLVDVIEKFIPENKLLKEKV